MLTHYAFTDGAFSTYSVCVGFLGFSGVQIFKKWGWWVCKALSSNPAPLKEKEKERKEKESNVAQRTPLLVLNTNVKTSSRCD